MLYYPIPKKVHYASLLISCMIVKNHGPHLGRLSTWFSEYLHVLMTSSLEKVFYVDRIGYIIQTTTISIINVRITLQLIAPNYKPTTAKEHSTIFDQRLINNNSHTLFFNSLHDTMYFGLPNLSLLPLHNEHVHTNYNFLFSIQNRH